MPLLILSAKSLANLNLASEISICLILFETFLISNNLLEEYTDSFKNVLIFDENQKIIGYQTLNIIQKK